MTTHGWTEQWLRTSSGTTDAKRWRRAAIAAAVFWFSACGGPPPEDVSLPNVEVSSSRDEQGQLCYVVNARQVGGQALRDCRATDDMSFFEFTNGLTIDNDDDGEPQQLSVILMHQPYTVTEVRFEGDSVPWRQQDNLLLVLGGRFMSVTDRPNAEIRFELGQYKGHCEYEPLSESCNLDLDN